MTFVHTPYNDTHQKFDDLWEQLDVESTSFLDYGEFMRAYLGEMSESRKALVRKVTILINTECVLVLCDKLLYLPFVSGL